MANYTAVARTNYFRVTDENRYQELFKNLVAEDTIEDFTKIKDGETYHAFGAYSWISYKDPDKNKEDGEYDIDVFLFELQKILPDDEAFMYFEAGNEKLRYINAYAFIVTKTQIKSIQLDTASKDFAKELLGEWFETQTCY